MDNIIAVALKAVVMFNGRALIIQRSSNDEFGANTWEFVGGKLNFGEDLEVALMREIQEESGLDVQVDRLLYATTFKTHEHRQVVILGYLCHATSDNISLSSEHKNYLWADKKQILELLPELLIDDLNKYNVWDAANIN